MASEKLKTASVLAFERKLDPSDALFYSGRWENRKNNSAWAKIPLREKQVRGTISNRIKTANMDPAKMDAEVQKPNLQKVDIASLPADDDTLKVVFTLRILGGVGKPSACNNPDYQKKLKSAVDSYFDAAGFDELAKRYAYNIASGRFLWRNRLGVEDVCVVTEQMSGGSAVNTWEFNALELSLKSFESDDAGLTKLTDAVKTGLTDKDSFALFRVTAYVRIGEGQEIYPSQELSLDTSGKKGEKSKFLYEVDGTAGMHSQKIGNALRTIDTWYPAFVDEGFPIAVEPYGSVTSMGKAFRQKADKADFYSLLDNWILKDKEPETEQQHYVMAVLVRGGVFGDSGKE